MPVQQLPLIKGTGKDFAEADYIDAIPVNMLATPRELPSAAGYMRSFPGIKKRADVEGKSRGVIYNTRENILYRVLGGRVYRGEKIIGYAQGAGRVSLACSATSQAVAANSEMILFRYDGTVKWLENWPEKEDGVEYAQYEIGSVRDICRAGARYVWIKDGSDLFGVTDLEDESHPDRFRPFYRANSQPDGIRAVAEWKGFIVCFGSSSIEYFSLTGATGATSPLYVANNSLTVNKGIAGTHCKAPFAGAYAFISSAASGLPSVYLVDAGQLQKIATPTIERVLRGYTADELATSSLESLSLDAHELLIMHLPRHTLCYDMSASQNGPQWCLLKSGVGDDVYRGIDFHYDGSAITVGDKQLPVLGELSFDISSQYDSPTEHLLFTPMIKVPDKRLFDFEVEAITGFTGDDERFFLSTTFDGLTFGREVMVPYSRRHQYDRRIRWPRIGRVRRNVGFKLRFVSLAPLSVSGCTVRIE
nr:MAG TPA: stabilization protein [Caudoviricetes sp.]